MQSDSITACTDKDRGRTVEELERELADAHRREAATAEVLRIISRSPTDVQPVFETIAESATLLCDGLYSVVFRFDGEMITVAADSCGSPQTSAFIRSAYPAPPGKGTLASRALLERQRPGQLRQSRRRRARACHWLPSGPVGADAEG